MFSDFLMKSKKTKTNHQRKNQKNHLIQQMIQVLY